MNVHALPGWLTRKQKEFRERFEELPAPSSTYGISIFSKPPARLFEAFSNAEPFKLDINEELAGARIISFKNALKEKALEKILEANFMKYAWPSRVQEKALVLHGGYIEDGILVHIPTGVRVEKPILLEKIYSAESRFQHLIVLAEKGSKVSIQDIPSEGNKKKFSSYVSEIIAEEGADISYASLKDGAWEGSFFHSMVSLGQDASFRRLEYVRSSSFSNVSSVVLLENEGARFEDKTIFAAGAGTIDMYKEILHQAPRTKSLMEARGALFGNAKAIWRGKVVVEDSAVESEAYQREDSILMSREAEIDAVPTLEIHTNAVKAKHAATTARLNPEHIFYLTSRGIEENKARELALTGFFEGMVGDGEYNSVRGAYTQDVAELISL